jgi:hypothetical protein
VHRGDKHVIERLLLSMGDFKNKKNKKGAQ